MKTLKRSFFTALFLLFLSCSEDESATIDTDVDISGAWEMTHYSLKDGKITYDFDGEKISSSFSASAKDYDYQVVFGTEPNVVSSSGSYTVILKTTTLGFTETEEVPVSTEDFGSEVLAGNWEIQGHSLVTIVDDVETVMEITELTENRMKLKINLEDAMDLFPDSSEGIDIDFFDTDISGIVRVTLER